VNNDIAHQPSRIPRIAWAIFMITLALAILPAATLRADRAEEDALRKSTRDAALERGMSAVDAKSWKLAAQYFEEARKANPGDPEVLFKLALATDRIGRRELLAIAWYRAFLATVPDAQTVARVKKQILVLEMRAEAKLLALLQTIEKTADMITDTKEKSGWFKDIARMQAELKDLVGQMEGSGDGQQAASTKAENIGEWTHRAHFWQEEQVIVNFDGFLKEQQGKSPAEATKVLIEAARELQFAVLLTRGAREEQQCLICVFGPSPSRILISRWFRPVAKVGTIRRRRSAYIWRTIPAGVLLRRSTDAAPP